MNDWTHDSLTALHAQNQPEADFADALEQKLRAMYASQQAAAPTKRAASRRLVYRLGGLAASLAILVGLFTFTPLRSVAQGILESLFSVAESNVMPVTESTDNAELSNPSLLTLEQVRDLAGFSVKVPTYPLDNYQFTGAGYTEERQAVSLLYEGPGRLLTITQQPLASAEQGIATDSSLGIGVGASLVEVAIGDQQGVFVAGMWVETEGGELAWAESGSRRRLRWIEGDMLYEIFAQGGSEGHDFIGQTEMVAIALSLQ